MAVYIVKAGDTLTSIAARHGIKSWQLLYNDPSNAAFRAKRPDPNRIFPGDQITIPPTAARSPGQAARPPASATGNQPNKYVMAIIDGTGPGSDSEYAASMKHSFCRQLGNALQPQGLGQYFRGPSWHGSEVESEAAAAFGYLLGVHRSDPEVRLMLAGYSRGGSAAIMAAELLKKEANIPVNSLFLFDAVARHRFPGGEVIPANVQFSRHARRDLQVRLIVKYEGSFSDVEVKGVSLTNSSNPMRPSFGNTGLTWEGPGDHKVAVAFPGSHGALGGVGWGFVQEDAACQRQVANFMNDQLKSRGVWNGLKPIDPKPAKSAKPSATELITGLMLDAALMIKHNRNLSKSGPVQ